MKSKLKTVLEFGGILGVVGKPSTSQISKFPDLRCGRY
jgi:hypothetical protein